MTFTHPVTTQQVIGTIEYFNHRGTLSYISTLKILDTEVDIQGNILMLQVEERVIEEINRGKLHGYRKNGFARIDAPGGYPCLITPTKLESQPYQRI